MNAINTTTSTTGNVSNVQILSEIGMTVENLASLRQYLSVGRYAQGLQAAQYWCAVGDIVSRIKAAKLNMKIDDAILAVLDCEISANERTFSMKMHDCREGLLAWYEESKCTKHNPRTIYEAYDKSRKPAPVEKDGDNEGDKGDKGDNEGDKGDSEKTVDFTTVSQALINARNMLKKAKEQKTIKDKEVALLAKLAAEIEALLK